MTLLERTRFIREQMPEGGLFDQKSWLVSPEAYPLDSTQIGFLEKLGQKLLKFQAACNLLYRQSLSGKQPEWIAEWLDAGKPGELLDIAHHPALKNELPRVIRPDLLMTEDGWALTELDSVPGGMGLTAWLCETYASLGEPVAGGATAMREALHTLLPEGPVVISEEASGYRPECEWIFGKERVVEAETYRFDGSTPAYRFFECFDWMNLPTLRESYSAQQPLTPPLKPFLEEKMWLAFLWMKPLREFWRRELGEGYLRDLLAIVPESWVVEPTPLPPTAVLPGLEAQSWQEVANYSQKQRQLILKISGFSPLAWGARGVTLGSDVSGEQWKEAVETALDSFSHAPYVMQRFHKAATREHPYLSPDGELRTMKGRARVCPYYFVENGKAHLKGVLVTHCPADKKIIHGMSDAVMVPAKAARELSD